MHRKEFIQLVSLLGLYPLASCEWESGNKKIPGKLLGASSGNGHKLRDQTFGESPVSEKFRVIIAGGGIAGLSAAYHLHKKGITDFILLEMEDQAGGNSRSGQNEISSYPWGAHYLPIPNLNQPSLISFLEEQQVITGYNERGIPYYNEEYLCFEPQERLFIKNRWQDGLVPSFGVPEKDLAIIKKFHSLMDYYSTLKGNDGRDAFTIPLSECSRDENITALDQVTFSAFLEKENLNSPFLHWYTDYCCRDDYGTSVKEISAWAGIHYFASRKGQSANSDNGDVLTWPQGNAWLASKLAAVVKEKIRSNAMIVGVNNGNVSYLDTKTNKIHTLQGEAVIMATPQFINARIIKEPGYKPLNNSYSPWVVANIETEGFDTSSGRPLSWDNVIYGNNSLGYVNACHQQLQTYHDRFNLTYYKPLTHLPAREARKEAMNKTHEEWVNEILSDLSPAHPKLRDRVKNIDVWLWGHAMAQPVPGSIFNTERENASKPLNNLFFAHSDLSVMSIFEEAFFHGHRAAGEVEQFISKSI